MKAALRRLQAVKDAKLQQAENHVRETNHVLREDVQRGADELAAAHLHIAQNNDEMGRLKRELTQQARAIAELHGQVPPHSAEAVAAADADAGAFAAAAAAFVPSPATGRLLPALLCCGAEDRRPEGPSHCAGNAQVECVLDELHIKGSWWYLAKRVGWAVETVPVCWPGGDWVPFKDLQRTPQLAAWRRAKPGWWRNQKAPTSRLAAATAGLSEADVVQAPAASGAQHSDGAPSKRQQKKARRAAALPGGAAAQEDAPGTPTPEAAAAAAAAAAEAATADAAEACSDRAPALTTPAALSSAPARRVPSTFQPPLPPRVSQLATEPGLAAPAIVAAYPSVAHAAPAAATANAASAWGRAALSSSSAGSAAEREPPDSAGEECDPAEVGELLALLGQGQPHGGGGVPALADVPGGAPAGDAGTSVQGSPPPPVSSPQPPAPLPLASSVSRPSPVVPEPPAELCCPITLALLEEPMMAADGHMYSRAVIEAWLAKSSASPMTGLPLPFTMLTPCHAVRGMVRAWREQQHGRAG